MIRITFIAIRDIFDSPSLSPSPSWWNFANDPRVIGNFHPLDIGSRFFLKGAKPIKSSVLNWSFVRFIDGKMVHAPIGNFLRSTWNFSPDYSAKKTRQVIKKVARTTPETGLNYSEKFNSLIISVTWYRFETFHATLHRLLLLISRL